MIEICDIEKPDLKECMESNMLFSSSYEHARSYGGYAISSFLDSLSIEWANCVIDTRFHSLKSGWYPGIPGWHLDDIPRDLDNGQPNLANPKYKSIHRMVIFDYGTGSMTEFADKKEIEHINYYKDKSEDFPLNGKTGETLWKTVDDFVNKTDGFEIKTVECSKVYEFGINDLHRAVPATTNGWRFFIRATRNSERPIHNVIRNQVQVYMDPINGGW